MSGWLIGIVGVVSLGVLIEILLPEGENSKYIKGIFSVIVIFVIISPLPKLAKGDYINGFNSDKQQISVDEDYYQNVKEDMQSKIQNSLKNKLQEAGYNDLSYDIKFDEEYVYIIDKIIIDTQDMSQAEIKELTKLLKSIAGNVSIETR
ncbi:MAG: stage III sporulation protein AF [Clostridia bacterium]|nr:stage III sporulation protein AF [Clostridia bacterium]